MLKKLIRHLDYSLIFVVIALGVFGVMMIYSSSYPVALRFNLSIDFFFKRQLIFLLVGCVLFLFAVLFPYKAYMNLTKMLVLLTFILLVIVFLAGKTTNNAQSWLSIGGFNIQPSELAKLAVIVYLSSVLAKKQSYIGNFGKAVFPPLVLVGFMAGLILIQPDFGSMIILVAAAACIIYSAKLRAKHVLLLTVIGSIGLAIFFTFMASDNQIGRFKGAYSPFENPKEGWQLVNSYIAIANGSISGVGLGNGTSKYGYLPEVQTDFIIANVSEELGFVGVLVTLIALFYIVIKGFIIGLRCKDTFGRLMAIGISSWIGIQAFINLGAASGLLPVTGVPLPFLSYGGSSMLVLMLSTGILVNISGFVNMRRKNKEASALHEQEEEVVKPTLRVVK
ncbi:stage V sporulation protein E [Fictibacillus macauensis ZFHKF-1]|uniref:Probable peptidoglycan glycosyltransferase FtsW n=1 Tax=Fictibacillus macauensis ZFHKF-1 TaxID=1196324 RepID=I8J395_9BACL|nr:FtsW/RodA/SpoVE family cell cycle protein [Fictibacillus macauensis]EIT86231.1 stage V sporulation protein E [Fictibacillus macauensis ZFHKF-1]